MNLRKIPQRILAHLKSFFLSGLLTLLPLIATVFIVTFTYSFIAKWLEPLRRISPPYIQRIPGSEFIIVTLAILLLGFLLRVMFITPVIHWFESLIKKIPIIRSIYQSSKTLVDFFSSVDKTDRKKVVLIEFPRKGLFNIAFLLESATDNYARIIPEHKKRPNATYYKVFMPNSPTPASGYFFILPDDEITHTDMTFDEAIKAIVSGGLITPESLKHLHQ